MDVGRAGLAREVGPPDVLKQPVAGEDDARIPGQGGEEVEFAGPQLKPTVADRRLAATRVDPETADLDRAAART